MNETMKRKITYLAALLLLLCTATLQAQEENESRKRIEYTSHIGINIGGTAPLPIPEEIREIKSYSPGVNPTIGMEVLYHFGNDSRWGIASGLTIEKRGMSTGAEVKNYRTEIIGENNNKLRGNWTGNVHTEVENWYITLPLLAVYEINSRISVKGGAFLSYLADGSFSGYVNDGYLRKNDPTGDKIIFDSSTKGTYDFSESLSEISWGVQAAADYTATDHLKICARLTWGLNDIFEKDFSTISFSMYPIYLNIGLGYRF